MNKYHRLLLPASLLAFAVSISSTLWSKPLTPISPEKVGMSSERLERIDDVFEAYVAEGKLPGATALVARKGRVVHFGVYGKSDLETGAEMQKDTLFRIASQTKAIVSVAIMVLQERGQLLIDDNLDKYLPEFAETTVAVAKDSGGYDIVPARRKITLRDLLRHTSGYSYGGGPAAELWQEAGIQGWYFADRNEPIRETIRRLAALPAEAHPGERFVYGYNTDILGVVVEVVSGQGLDVFLKENIFEPLEMVDTHFYLPKEKKSRLATVYSKSGDGPLEKAPEPGHMVGQGHYVEGPRMSFSGGAGLVSSTDDYAVFLQMLANGGEYGGKRIVSRKTVELMTVDHLPEGVGFPWGNGTGFGLGFRIAEDLGANGTLGSLGSYGWGGAYHSTYWVDPEEQLVVAYFTQVIPANGLDDHAKLQNLIYQAIVD